MPILKIEKLTKKYGKTYALNGLDMEVKKGDIYGFVGPNGAGKTTTLRIISGLLKSDGGDLWLDGVRTTKNILKQKSLIGFVPDFFGVYENLNVIEYLEFFAASYGIYGRAGTVRAREVLEMVELSGKEEQMVDSLSRGIQQRLCLARAMIHKPKLLVLDEPNSGLDPRSRKDFQLLLQRLAREDYTILISSHILSELADLCTSIGVINGGVMVQQGKLENIMLAIDSSNPLRITVLNQVPKALELLRQDPQVSRLSVDENKIAEVCRNNGYTMSQIYKSTLIGITDMEKLMGRKIFKELLGDYIIKPKGRLTLVPETDKREEVHTLGEFRKEF